MLDEGPVALNGIGRTGGGGRGEGGEREGREEVRRKLWLSIITQHSALIAILRKVCLAARHRGTN